MAVCFDKRVLSDFARGDLPEAEAADVECHLESCRACARLLAAMPVDEGLLADLREVVQAREELEPSLAVLGELESKFSTTLFNQ